MAPGDIAAVAIGRNEGERLVACLRSLVGTVGTVVYVDSGSTDASVANAGQLGATVAALDMSRPFTAARARNLGLQTVQLLDPRPRYVLVVDGDCAVEPGWIRDSMAFLEAHPDAGAVCGRRRERFPAHSLYNRMCDWEWNTPVGEAAVCGGDALMRLEALEQAGLYDDTIIAGEDEEVCLRMRSSGWRIWRIDAPMTVHDADIRSFGQWWKRMVRAGHAFAHVGTLHPAHFAAQRRRIWLWAVALPLLALAGAALTVWLPAVVAGLYSVSWLRGLGQFRRHGMTFPQSAGCSALLVLSKFANLQGYALYWLRRLRSERPTIIEYK